MRLQEAWRPRPLLRRELLTSSKALMSALVIAALAMGTPFGMLVWANGTEHSRVVNLQQEIELVGTAHAVPTEF